jgi:hypothetical protein
LFDPGAFPTTGVRKQLPHNYTPSFDRHTSFLDSNSRIFVEAVTSIVFSARNLHWIETEILSSVGSAQDVVAHRGDD